MATDATRLTTRAPRTVPARPRYDDANAADAAAKAPARTLCRLMSTDRRGRSKLDSLAAAGRVPASLSVSNLWFFDIPASRTARAKQLLRRWMVDARPAPLPRLGEQPERSPTRNGPWMVSPATFPRTAQPVRTRAARRSAVPRGRRSGCGTGCRGTVRTAYGPRRGGTPVRGLPGREVTTAWEPPVGIEPTTYALRMRRSGQLS